MLFVVYATYEGLNPFYSTLNSLKDRRTNIALRGNYAFAVVCSLSSELLPPRGSGWNLAALYCHSLADAKHSQVVWKFHTT